MIYLDNAATTRLDDTVLDAMLPFMKDGFYNPSSSYGEAREVRCQIEAQRALIAGFINADPESVYFTSGGTEADNWAVRAAVRSGKGKHIITSAYEHPAVFNTMKDLESQGYEITYIDPDSNGRIDPDSIAEAVKEDTVLISVMHANNETGNINPIEEIGRIAKERNILFHTDAVQSIGHIRIDVKKNNIDLLSVSSHKIYGPKGSGFLYISPAIKAVNLLFGGSQEFAKRPGTENVPGIIGLGKAVEILDERLEKEHAHDLELKNRLISLLNGKIPDIKINGSGNMLPNILNVTFPQMLSENLLFLTDIKGICLSAGSACASGAVTPSRTLTSMGLSSDLAMRTIRFSIGRYNDIKDIETAAAVIEEIINNRR